MPIHVSSHAELPANTPYEPRGGEEQVIFVYGRWLYSNTVLSEWVPVPAGGSILYSPTTVDGEYDLGLGEEYPRSMLQNVTLTGNATFLFAPPPSMQRAVAHEVVLVLQQDETGGRTVTLDDVTFPGGTAPAFSTDPDAVDIVTVLWTGDLVGWAVTHFVADVKA